MGNTYWLQTRIDRTYCSESNDLSLIYDLTSKLDGICKKRGATPVTEFNDLTDLEYNFMDDDGEKMPELDQDTGLAYGLDEMAWFDVQTGINTFEVIESALEEGIAPKLDDEQRALLSGEVKYCLARLHALEGANTKFHLAVIM